MKVDEHGIWIRCWDGSEMEYEHFSNKELNELITLGLSNYGICMHIYILATLDFSIYLDDLR